MRKKLMQTMVLSLALSVLVSMSSVGFIFADSTDVAEETASTETTEVTSEIALDTEATDTTSEDGSTTTEDTTTETDKDTDTTTTPEKTSTKKTLRLTWINVGDGDSILIKLPNNEFILVDGGLKSKSTKVMKVVKKQMKAAGATKIKYIINTHNHDDHVGGLIKVIKSKYVSKSYTTFFYSKKCSFKKGAAKQMMTAVKKKGLKRIYPKYKYSFKEGGVKVTFAQPNQKFKSGNENSLALWIEYKGKKVLLTGDCSHHVQSTLLKKKADVLDMPHHGAIGGTSKKFFRRYGSPKYVVVSSDGKSHGHPCPYAFECLHKVNKKALAYRTDKLGDITCTITYNTKTKKTSLKMSPKGKNAKVYITKKAPRAYWVKLMRQLAKKS